MTVQDLIAQAVSCGWEKSEATTGKSWFTVLKRGKYEIWVESDVINIMENEGDFGYGRGIVEVSKLITADKRPWIIGLFGPIVSRWFSLKANRFLDN